MNHQLENAVSHQAVVQGGRAAAPLKSGPGLWEERAGVSETSGTTEGFFQRKKKGRKRIQLMDGDIHSTFYKKTKHCNRMVPANRATVAGTPSSGTCEGKSQAGPTAALKPGQGD